jgi:hypothetical protein
MSPSSADTVAVVLEVPAHLAENFEKAEAFLLKEYGVSPPVQDLMRIWLACANSWDVVTEFESAVRDLKRGTLSADKEGRFNEHTLGL